jgi:hypothetical protein
MFLNEKPPLPSNRQQHYARFARERHHERIDEITLDSGGRGGVKAAVALRHARYDAASLKQPSPYLSGKPWERLLAPVRPSACKPYLHAAKEYRETRTIFYWGQG